MALARESNRMTRDRCWKTSTKRFLGPQQPPTCMIGALKHVSVEKRVFGRLLEAEPHSLRLWRRLRPYLRNA